MRNVKPFKLNLLLKLNPSILCVQQHHKKAISLEKWRTGARERVEVMWNSGSKKWREAAKLLQLVSKVIGHFKKLWNIKFGWTNIGWKAKLSMLKIFSLILSAMPTQMLKCIRFVHTYMYEVVLQIYWEVQNTAHSSILFWHYNPSPPHTYSKQLSLALQESCECIS